MSPDNLSIVQQRNLALGLLGLLVLGIGFGVISPLMRRYADNRDHITALQKKLDRYEVEVASRDEVMLKTEAIKKNILAAGIFSTEQSIPLVQAAMQAKISQVVADAGGSLSSTQNLSQKTLQGLTKLGINASFSSNMGSLKNILYELESARPYMMIESIKISAAGNLGVQADGLGNANKVNVLADIVSYLPKVNE